MKIILLLILISFAISTKYYTIQPGDTLYSIGRKFGVTVQKLCEWNNISNPDVINAGTILIVEKDGTDSGSNKKGKIDKVTDLQMQKMGWTNYNLNDLNNCIRKFSINTVQRIRHFIAQCSHESGLGKYTEELGGISHCSKYEGRKDLGNTQNGDGCRFKGAGYIQLTGRSNYQSFANYIGDSRVMEGVSYVSSKYPWTSAGYWWKSHGLNSLCDNGASVDVITKRVNGGYNGLAERKKYYQRACNIFN